MVRKDDTYIDIKIHRPVSGFHVQELLRLPDVPLGRFVPAYPKNSFEQELLDEYKQVFGEAAFDKKAGM